MERQTAVLGVSLAVLLSLAGFYIGFLYDQEGSSDVNTNEFPMKMNVTVNSDDQIKEARFDDKSFELMAEDSDEARFYFDFDKDGSFDREISIESDDTLRNTTELVQLDNSTYRLYLTYRDDPDINEDAFMTLFRVEKP